MRLLLVEDHTRLAGFIEKGLSRAGFSIDNVWLLEDAMAAVSTTRYDAVVLDLGLPDGDGMDLIGRLRSDRDSTPVLVLTARDGLQARVEGLNAGADDYVLKPFEMEELVARLRALLRRPCAALGLALTVGNLVFDTAMREATVGGQRVLMTRRELAALELLLRRIGKVVPKDVIEETLYGFNEEVISNAVEVVIHRLRKSLQDVGASAKIHTVRGVGYWLSEDAH